MHFDTTWKCSDEVEAGNNNQVTVAGCVRKGCNSQIMLQQVFRKVSKDKMSNMVQGTYRHAFYSLTFYGHLIIWNVFGADILYFHLLDLTEHILITQNQDTWPGNGKLKLYLKFTQRFQCI